MCVRMGLEAKARGFLMDSMTASSSQGTGHLQHLKLVGPIHPCRYTSMQDMQKAEAFAPHYDGVFVRSPDEMSVYTVLIYLNDDFGDGNTHFFHPSRTSLFLVRFRVRRVPLIIDV